MNSDEQTYHTIGETSQLTGIPVQTLRRWCDAGRIECRRSPNGYRLIPSSAVEELRRHGLQAFKPADRESGEPADHRPARSPSERLGLLGEPSPELRHIKEQLEGTKMQLELAQVTRQLDELDRQEEEQRRQVQGEEEMLAEREEAEREQEQLRAQEARRLAQEGERRATWEKARDRWLRRQVSQAASKLRRKACWLDLQPTELTQALADLNDTLVEALDDFSHESALYEVFKAQDEVIARLLRPFERRKEQNKIIEECRKEIRRYLSEQRDKGWLDIRLGDIDFLARQLERPVMAVVEKEVRSKALSEGQAEEYLREVIDQRLSLI